MMNFRNWSVSLGSHFPIVRRCESDMKWSVNSQKNGMKANAFFGQDEDVEELKNFVGDQKALMSWKMDGLTIVLTYRGGHLFKAVTRGNGEVGEVITNNAKVFKNVPLQIRLSR